MFALKYLAVLYVLCATALGQNIAIGAPAAGSSITSGTNITVEVDKPESLTPSDDVAIVIGLRPCTSVESCETVDPESQLGIVLYQGPFNPQFSNVTDHKPPHQNFTVTIPTLSAPNAVLAVVHFVLVEAGPHVQLDVANLTLTVA